MAAIINAADDSGSSSSDIPLDAKTVDAIVRFLVNELLRLKRLPQNSSDEIIDQVLHRESLGSTGVGRGVAIPHAQTDFVQAPEIVIGRCSGPIDWPGSADGSQVTTVCLVVTPRTQEAQLEGLKMAADRLRSQKPI